MTWKTLLIAVLLALVSFGVGAYYRFNRIYVPDAPVRHEPDPWSAQAPDTPGDPGGEQQQQGEPDPLYIAGRINILVLGEDNVEKVKRSDTMLFVAIDVDEKNIRVLSLPRDTRVSIPRHGNQKLNHAYAFGGVELLRTTVERFLGTDIHYYIKIDYDNFPQLVDIVGGVDIFVGKAMKYRDRKQKLEINIPAGKQRMNGETALKYVRFRNDALGDIGRIRRQQQFLKAFLHRIYEADNLLRFPSIMEQIKNTIATDMEPSMILQLGSFVRRFQDDQNRIFFSMLPGEAALIDGLSYWIAKSSGVERFLKSDIQDLADSQKADISTAADYSPDAAEGYKAAEAEASSAAESAPSTSEIHEHLQGISHAVAVLNGSGKGGVAQAAATHLQKIGVDVIHTGNAKHFDYRYSIVIYPEGSSPEVKATAAALAKLCGVPSNLTRADKQATYPSLVVGHNYEALTKRLENSYAMVQ